MAGTYELSLYGGMNQPAHSSVKFSGASNSYGVNDGSYSTEGWKGKSFESPIYYGWRLGYWFDDTPWGVGLDFNHSKVIPETLPAGLRRLEFTDGLNTFTVTGFYKLDSKIFVNLQPYFGVGIGISYPHVEITGTSSSTGKTYEYQSTGLAYQVLGGLKFPLYKDLGGFAEYRLTFTPLEADLNGGGKFKSDINNNQLSFGITYKF
jgi:lipid A oxidase